MLKTTVSISIGAIVLFRNISSRNITNSPFQDYTHTLKKERLLMPRSQGGGGGAPKYTHTYAPACLCIIEQTDMYLF